MKKWLKLLPGVTVLIFLASCSGRTTVNVQEMNRQFINAWNTRDSARIDSMLAPDVQFLQADGHYSGKSEVVAKWVKQGMASISNLKTNVISSDTDAHSAYEAGTFSVDVTSPGQPAVMGEGNYILIWKKQADDRWKVSYIQLEDLPLQSGKK